MDFGACSMLYEFSRAREHTNVHMKSQIFVHASAPVQSPALPISKMESQSHVALLALLVLGAVTGVYLFFQSAPEAEFPECAPISVTYVIQGVLPTWLNGRNDKMGTVQGLWQCASQYREHHAGFVLSSFCIVYIALQTFAIPGPIVLSILSGAMYPFLQAQMLVAFCATTGASLCFMLSYFLGRGVFSRLLAGMIGRFKEKIAQNQGNLFYYLLFLRITPLLPNWFVNIACPLVGVPFKYFFLATLIGLIPANFLHISTGATLNNAAGASGTSNAVNFAVLFLLQFVALLPTLFKGKIEKYEKEAFEKNKKTK